MVVLLVYSWYSNVARIELFFKPENIQQHSSYCLRKEMMKVSSNIYFVDTKRFI